MPVTLSELEARVNQLSNRVNALATSAQVTELKNLLINYKASTDADITDIQGRLDSQESKINDHETRLQALGG
jgi:hypothetical protein